MQFAFLVKSDFNFCIAIVASGSWASLVHMYHYTLQRNYEWSAAKGGLRDEGLSKSEAI